MPVVAIAPRDPWYEKMLSQVEQAKARGGTVIAVCTDGDEQMAALYRQHVLGEQPLSQIQGVSPKAAEPVKTEAQADV